MSTRIRFLRQPERGQIRQVPFRVGVDLIARGEAEDARNLQSAVDSQPVPAMAKAPVVAAKPTVSTEIYDGSQGKPMRRHEIKRITKRKQTTKRKRK